VHEFPCGQSVAARWDAHYRTGRRKILYSQTYYSIGGGFIVDEEHFGLPNNSPVNVPYPYKSAADLQRHCQETGLSLSGLMMQNELALHSKEELEQHFANVWEVMRSGIERGITTEGVLPGKLRVPRRAAALRRMLVSSDKTTTTRWRSLTGSTCSRWP
jgi:L-serine dehydratase